MYDHIGLRVGDVARSARFYAAALAPLGCVQSYEDAQGAGFGPPGAPALWLHAGGDGSKGAHVAFRAPSREAVAAFHAAGLAAGGKDNGAAGLRLDYSPTYYAAFMLDPDGNNVEAVWGTE